MGGGSGRCKAKDVISLEAEEKRPDTAIPRHDFLDNKLLRALPLTSVSCDITATPDVTQEHQRQKENLRPRNKEKS